jgi:hypothetical protein
VTGPDHGTADDADGRSGPPGPEVPGGDPAGRTEPLRHDPAGPYGARTGGWTGGPAATRPTGVPSAPRPPGPPVTVPGGVRPPLPQRPPVPTGIPPRPTPLPPPRPNGSPTPEARPRPDAPTEAIPVTGSAATTVVPGRAPGRPAAPRPPLTSPLSRPVKGRKARLALRRLDPWSVFVMSLLLSLFLAVVTIVAAVLLYVVLDALGVPDSINRGVTDVKGGADILTRGRFLGGATLLAAVNVVLLTAFATLGSLLYNVCASFTGGLELTLAERD